MSFLLLFVDNVTTWTNGNATGIASDPLNWTSGVAPGDNGAVAIFDGTSTDDCDWDITAGVGEYKQLAGYTGTVTQSVNVTTDQTGTQNGKMTLAAGFFVDAGFNQLVDGSSNFTGATVTLTGKLIFTGASGTHTFTTGSKSYNAIEIDNASMTSLTQVGIIIANSFETKTGAVFTDASPGAIIDGDIIIHPSSTFNSTNIWIPDAEGDLSNPTASNAFSALNHGTGFDTTLIADCFTRTFSGGGAMSAMIGAFNFVLYHPTQNDFFDKKSTAFSGAGTLVFKLQQGDTLTNKGFVISNSWTCDDDDGYTLSMTSGVTCATYSLNSLVTTVNEGPADTANSAPVINWGSSALITSGDVVLSDAGASGEQHLVKMEMGANQVHNIAGLIRTASLTDGRAFLDLETCKLAINDGIHGQRITIDAGTSTIRPSSGPTEIDGSHTWFNFTANTSNQTMVFDNTATQTITGLLSLTGAVRLTSDNPGTQYTFDVQGTQDVDLIRVIDCLNIGTQIRASRATDQGNNNNTDNNSQIGWRFIKAVIEGFEVQVESNIILPPAIEGFEVVIDENIDPIFEDNFRLLPPIYPKILPQVIP